jgi:hypothetical protein
MRGTSQATSRKFQNSGMLFKLHDTFAAYISYTFACHPLSTADGITNGLKLLSTFSLESKPYGDYLKLN